MPQRLSLILVTVIAGSLLASCGIDPQTLENTPDLVVDSITTSPGTPESDDSIDVIIVIKNRGAEFTDDFQLELRVLDGSSTLVVHKPAEAISNDFSTNETFTHTITIGTLTADTYELIVTLDTVDSIDEVQEDNNVETRSLTVAPAT